MIIMKYIVWQACTEWYGYAVEANSPEEAKEIYLSDDFDRDCYEIGGSDPEWGDIEIEEA